MKTARILLSTMFVLFGLMLFSTPAQAAGSLHQLEGAMDTLTDSTPSHGSTHIFTFTVGEGSGGISVQSVKFEFCKEAFGNGDGTCTQPGGLGITNAAGTLASTGGTVITPAQWSIGKTGTKEIYMHNVGGPVVIADHTVFTASLSAITNNSIDGCDNSDQSAGTCYVRIYLCSTDVASDNANCTPTAENTVVEGQTIVSYTVIASVLVTARVDPAFTFKVEGVNESVLVPNAGAGVMTTVKSTFQTLPFAHLTPDEPKYAAHKLTVKMNTTSGYSVTMKMRDQMKGGYRDNNIDSFASDGVTWDNPKAWANPSGTAVANIDSGWIAANTDNGTIGNGGTVTGWAQGSTTIGLWGPVDQTDHPIMAKASSDDGTKPTTVTYVIGVSVTQPADTYSGELVYNALPLY